MENGNAKITISISFLSPYGGVVFLSFEFCAEKFNFIDKAIAAGAGRIELCDN